MLSPNLVFVTGMHRSGTSVAARAVQACGFAMGTNLMPGSRDNPRGFFEDLELVAINDALMGMQQVSWNTAKSPIPIETTDKLLDRVSNFIEDHVLKWGSRAALKDPRFCITYPIWVESLKHNFSGVEWAVVGSVRNPLETLQSVMLRDGMSRDATIALWKTYNNGLLDFMAESPTGNAYMTIYEKFLREPMNGIISLNNFLRGDLDNDSGGAFVDFMTESLHRHRAEMPNFEEFDAEFAKLYVQLYARTEDAVGLVT